MSKENFSALVTMTKIFLAPMTPLQYFLDTPGLSHDYFLRQAYIMLTNDGKDEVRTFFSLIILGFAKDCSGPIKAGKMFAIFMLILRSPEAHIGPGRLQKPNIISIMH